MTTENNKIIAEFMGFIITEDKVIIPKIYESEESPFSLLKWIDDFREVENLPPNSLNNLHFHSDWNWLMEVVEKIKSLGYRTLTENECFMITKSKLSSFDVRSKDDYSTIFSDNYEINHYGGSKKENVYNACVEFIKYYNEQTR